MSPIFLSCLFMLTTPNFISDGAMPAKICSLSVGVGRYIPLSGGTWSRHRVQGPSSWRV